MADINGWRSRTVPRRIGHREYRERVRVFRRARQKGWPWHGWQRLARLRGQRKGASVGSVQDNGELRITRELEQAHLEEIRF
jgi:hypothetical protein